VTFPRSVAAIAMHDQPHLPPRPDFEPASRRSWLPILLATIFGILLAAGFSIITLGYFLPLFALGALMFGVIFLQYLLWGWLFEKIYRSRAGTQAEEPPPEA
jgi:hypothetical protein